MFLLKHKARLHTPRMIEKKLHGFVILKRRRISTQGDLHPFERIKPFFLKVQGLSGSDENLNLWRIGKHCAEKRRSVHQMLKVIEQQQHGLIAQVFEELRFRLLFTIEDQIQRLRNRLDQEFAPRELLQAHDNDAILKMRVEIAGRLDRQARLPAAAKTKHREQAAGRIEYSIPDLVQLSLAANKNIQSFQG